MTRLTDHQANQLIVVLVVAAVVAIVLLLRAEAKAKARGPRLDLRPTFEDRHSARIALWFGENSAQPLTPAGVAYLTFLRERRELRRTKAPITAGMFDR